MPLHEIALSLSEQIQPRNFRPVNIKDHLPPQSRKKHGVERNKIRMLIKRRNLILLR
jgi:hypothetical protein